MRHEIDKHLVASSLYLQRVAGALEKIDLRTVPKDRRERLKVLRDTAQTMLKDLEIVRVGEDDHFRRHSRVQPQEGSVGT